MEYSAGHQGTLQHTQEANKSLSRLHRHKHMGQQGVRAKASFEWAVRRGWGLELWLYRGCTAASQRHKPQTWTLDFSDTPFLTSKQAGDLAWRISVKIIGGVNAADGARPAQMGCLKFWPAKTALSPSSSSILWESASGLLTCTCHLMGDQQITWPLTAHLMSPLKYAHVFLTHLSSWLYLAKRSERQGAPVLIWRRK